MTTIDPITQNQTTTSFSDPVQTVLQNDEFDLGITQEAPAQQQASPSLSNEANQSEPSSPENASFDFSLDLPDTYPSLEHSQAPKSEPENAETSPSLAQDPQPQPQEAATYSSQEQTATPFFQNESSSDASTDLSSASSNQEASVNDSSLQAALRDDEPLWEQSERFFGQPVAETVAELPEDTTLNPELLVQNEPVSANADWVYLAPSEVSQEISSEIPSSEPTLTFWVSETQPEMNSEIQPNIQQGEENSQEKALNLDEMIFHFSENDASKEQTPSLQSTQDPFSAMKSTIEAYHQEKEQEKIENEEVLNPSALLEEGTLETNAEEASVQSHAQEEITQSQFQEQPLQSSLQEEVLPVVSQQSDVPAPLQQEPPQALSQEQPLPNAHSTLEIPSSLSSLETPVAATPTLDLDMLTAVPVNPLTHPSTYPQSVSVQKPASQKKWLGVALGVIGVLLLGALAFMRYPDLFVMLGNKLPVQTSMVPNAEQEHGSAAELDDTMPVAWDLETLDGERQTPPDQDEDVTVLDVDVSDFSWTEESIPTITLNDAENSDSPDSQAQDSSVLENPLEPWVVHPSLENEENDPLAAVENLVGPVNNNDLMKQEILQYQQRGQQLKEQWDLLAKKGMMKYGLAVEKETQKLLDQLANGENIDISMWSDKKLILDDYLDKATNA